ncbi:MAG: transcription elongation factor Spt5 [Candidatus Methanogaster sp.]|uniref:Transcription elongation factor Spt5 n=1 Tax=Candidatus Methanogaster sp. TaxID=3386292 RepID=A0AC61L1C6_9EURY|nr:MAG: transcription elongation factor Spt5 [ANME-2 cluster archaeon]
MSEESVYVVKTTANQERSVANILAQLAQRDHYDIRAILVPDELRGYLLVESGDRDELAQAVQMVQHARSLVQGESSIEEVEHFLTPKPTVTGISVDSIVELISGPFKGEKARVKRVDEAHEEITVELFEAMVPIPVTVRGDHVRVLKREGE